MPLATSMSVNVVSMVTGDTISVATGVTISDCASLCCRGNGQRGNVAMRSKIVVYLPHIYVRDNVSPHSHAMSYWSHTRVGGRCRGRIVAHRKRLCNFRRRRAVHHRRDDDASAVKPAHDPSQRWRFYVITTIGGGVRIDGNKYGLVGMRICENSSPSTCGNDLITRSTTVQTQVWGVAECE